ncbi:MAG: GGDEF domain-containing protein, partial [Burkholderiales bacterium]
LLSTNLRGTDKPARYGGEEFAILSPDLPKMAAAAMAERLRGIVAGHVFTVSGEDKKTLVIPLTVSLGVAIYPDHGDTPDDIFKAADMAMYHAKDLGRNTVASLKGPPA